MEHNTLCPINTMNKTLNYAAKIYCFCIEEVKGRAFSISHSKGTKRNSKILH